MKKALVILISLAMTFLALSAQSISAGEKPFAKIVPALDGAPPRASRLAREQPPIMAQSMDQSTR